MIDLYDTLIAVTIYVVDVRDVSLIPASDVDGTVWCVDRIDRIDRMDGSRRGGR